MTEPLLIEAARTVADALEREGFDHAFGGAIALAYWGVPRATVDVDVGVAAEPMQLPELFAALRAGGCELDEGRAAEAAIRGDFGCRAHGVRVDVFLPVLPLARSALDRRVRVPFSSGSDRGYLERWVGVLFPEGDPRLAVYEQLTSRAGI